MKELDSTFWCEKAVHSTGIGDYLQALKSYNRALELNPSDDRIWSRRGTILTILGRDLEAIISYNKAMKILVNTV